ncbi:MAG: hypothetical protein KIT02_00080 [Devosia sp.]|uniref:hypothetical protein n=1 Tax=Devosia sp. TaxID=1871048 RepID=UPI0024C55C2D|nr:hypothetical protein [Devosia sp.]UYN99685.1 MAG: hypothetical protein KIT02_00080 [Devosia sp.]
MSVLRWAMAGLLLLAAPVALAKDKPAGEAGTDPLSDWVGVWAASAEQTVTITRTAEGLFIDGFATWGASDPARVEIGAVNMGEFSLELPENWVGADGSVNFTVGEEGPLPPEAAGQYDCVIGMLLELPVLKVTDNGYCGGMNVTFYGEYRRHKKGG